MAYDRELAERLREALEGQRGLTEKAMFGGLAFLINGNLAVSASSRGGLLLRCPPENTELLTDNAGVDRFVMRGREMDGWLRVDPSAIDTDADLARWVAVGRDHAESLPPKTR